MRNKIQRMNVMAVIKPDQSNLASYRSINFHHRVLHRAVQADRRVADLPSSPRRREFRPDGAGHQPHRRSAPHDHQGALHRQNHLRLPPGYCIGLRLNYTWGLHRLPRSPQNIRENQDEGLGAQLPHQSSSASHCPESCQPASPAASRRHGRHILFTFWVR